MATLHLLSPIVSTAAPSGARLTVAEHNDARVRAAILAWRERNGSPLGRAARAAPIPTYRVAWNAPSKSRRIAWLQSG